MTGGYRVIVGADDGKRHMVDAGGVRYLTEEHPGFWELAIGGGNWPAIVQFAKDVLATSDPDGKPA